MYILHLRGGLHILCSTNHPGHPLVLSFTEVLVLSFTEVLVLSFTEVLVLSFTEVLVLSFTEVLVLCFTEVLENGFLNEEYRTDKCFQCSFSVSA
ncbi:MAG: hypothetical protein ABII90_00940 [Bacteroidota bacterium]